MKLAVAAIIATYRRPRELARLLDSLAQIRSLLAAVVVVDNGASAEVCALVEAARCPAHYLDPGKNLGCGGGLRLAGPRALELAGENCTHLLVLDDDAVVGPDTLAILAAAMEHEHATLACPLVVNGHDLVYWLPGFADHARERGRVGGLSVADFRARFGNFPLPIIWAQGICLLVARHAVELHGVHRDDFWVRGEDLEFSLRFTAHGRGIFVPAAIAGHIPPPEPAASPLAVEYLKHCAHLQNIAHIGLRLPHGARIAWTLAGALRHFFSVWGWRSVADALRALWRGAVLGEPAGRGAGRTFRARCAALEGPA